MTRSAEDRRDLGQGTEAHLTMSAFDEHAHGTALMGVWSGSRSIPEQKSGAR